MMQRSGYWPSALDHVAADRYIKAGRFVCERWQTFTLFLVDMGECPSEHHTIDRRDSRKGYEPGNCRWATTEEQNEIKRCSLCGEEGHTKRFHEEPKQIELKTFEWRGKIRQW